MKNIKKEVKPLGIMEYIVVKKLRVNHSAVNFINKIVFSFYPHMYHQYTMTLLPSAEAY